MLRPKIKSLNLQYFARFKLGHTVFMSTVPAGRPASAGSWDGSAASWKSQYLQGFQDWEHDHSARSRQKVCDCTSARGLCKCNGSS